MSLMGPMNTMLKIDGTFFQFPEGWETTVFDEWPQYLKPASSLGLKGCDILAINGGTLWIIEVKDYTYPDAKQPEDLATVVGQKAIGTMALLYALQRSKNDSAAVRFARACTVTTEIKLALHIEIKDGGRKERQVRPLLMSLEQKLQNIGKMLHIKAHVTSTLAPNPAAPWEFQRDSTTRGVHVDR